MTQLQFGRILKPHGVHGAFSLELYFQNYETFCQHTILDDKPFPITHIGGTNSKAIFSSTLVSSPEDAKILSGKILYIPRDIMSTPECGYYMGDLPGLSVIDINTDKTIGIVTDVVNFGSLDMIEFQNMQEKLEYLEIRDETILNVDLKRKIIIIKPYEYED